MKSCYFCYLLGTKPSEPKNMEKNNLKYFKIKVTNQKNENPLLLLPF